MSQKQQRMKMILEAALMAATEPLSLHQLKQLLGEYKMTESAVKVLLQALEADYKDRAVELKQVASGYRFQVRDDYACWVNQALQIKPPRYSQALLETLALIVYRQPITRGEIEAIRGVTVSAQIIRTLMEHQWIQVVDYKDTPGRPALYGTTKYFLDHFNLKGLNELPEIPQLQAANLTLDNETTQ